jgi:hypothetical protein
MPEVETAVQLEEVFEAGLPAVLEARRLTNRFLRGQIPPPKLDDLRLLVSELVAQTVSTSARFGGGIVGMTLEKGPGLVRVVVGFPMLHPASRHRLQWSMPELRETLVRGLADRWGTEVDAPPKIWAEVDVP